MRHVIVANVAGSGYQFLRVEHGDIDRNRSYPASSTSDEFEATANSLRSQLSQKRQEVNFLLVVHLGDEKRSSVIAYGGKLPIADEYGRVGLSFLHAIKVAPSQIARISYIVGERLTLSGVSWLTEVFGALASGQTSPESAVRMLTKNDHKLVNNFTTGERFDSHISGQVDFTAFIPFSSNISSLDDPGGWRLEQTHNNVLTLHNSRSVSEAYDDILSSLMWQLIGLRSSTDLTPKTLSIDVDSISKLPLAEDSVKLSASESSLTFDTDQALTPGTLIVSLVDLNVDDLRITVEAQNRKYRITKSQVETGFSTALIHCVARKRWWTINQTQCFAIPRASLSSRQNSQVAHTIQQMVSQAARQGSSPRKRVRVVELVALLSLVIAVVQVLILVYLR